MLPLPLPLKKRIISRLLWLLISAFFILLITALTVFRPVVIITVERGADPGREIYGHFLLPGERFTYSYLHSVEKTPVQEVYQTGWAGNFSLAVTRFQSYGAGLPLDIRGFSLEDGYFIIEDPGITLREIRIRVSRFPGQTLTFNNKFNQQEYKLQILARPGELVIIRNISLVGWYLAASRLIS